MPAGIQINDKVVATEKTWHGLETIVKKIDFDNCGLDWPVECSPIQSDTGIIIPNYKLISTPTASNPRHPLAVMKSRYTPIQNSAIYGAVKSCLEGIPHIITCAGSLEDRKKVFISVRLTGKGNAEFEVNGEKFKANLNFLTSHDGSGSFFIFDSNTRVVCMNTFNMAMSDRLSAEVRRHARHTKNHDMKITQITAEIKNALAGRDIFKAECEKLVKIKCSEDEAVAFAVGLLFPGHRSKPSASVITSAQGIAAAFSRGDGNSGSNRYDLFNGFTQFFTRNTSRSDSDTYSSSFNGVGAQRKAQAFDALVDKDAFKKTMARGKAGLALAN